MLRNEALRRARQLARLGWFKDNLRRIDGGTDYWVPPAPEAALPTPLADVPPEKLSKAEGHTALMWARALLHQGYSPEYVEHRTGWGAWWLR